MARSPAAKAIFWPPWSTTTGLAGIGGSGPGAEPPYRIQSGGTANTSAIRPTAAPTYLSRRPKATRDHRPTLKPHVRPPSNDGNAQVKRRREAQCLTTVIVLLPPQAAARQQIAAAASPSRSDPSSAQELDVGDAAVPVLEDELHEPAAGREPGRAGAAAERKALLDEGAADGERAERPGRDGDRLEAEHPGRPGDAEDRVRDPARAARPARPGGRIRRQDRLEPEVHQVERREEVTSFLGRERGRPELRQLRDRRGLDRPPDVCEPGGGRGVPVGPGHLDRARRWPP